MLDSKTALQPKIEMRPKSVLTDSANPDNDLLEQLQEARMEIPTETTRQSYIDVDAEVRSTMELKDDAIINVVSSNADNSEDDDDEQSPLIQAVSVPEVMQCMGKIRHSALQKKNAEACST